MPTKNRIDGTDLFQKLCYYGNVAIFEDTLSGLGVAQVHHDPCALHWRLVKDWGARMNLSAPMSDADAAALHYADSLRGAELLRNSVLDIGSGAGFPGIPLAIARPDLQFVLLEPRRKRCSFLKMAITRLGLSHVTVREGRIEDPPSQLFETIVSRATFSETDRLKHCARWLTPDGVMLFWRSDPSGHPDTEFQRYALSGRERGIEIWRSSSPL